MPSADKLIDLASQAPFGRGGKRECYVHPAHPDRCIKVHRPDKRPEDLRRALGLWRRWRKSVADLDESQQDYAALRYVESLGDPTAWTHLPRCHGWVDTSRGRGLVVDLIRDADGLISRSFLDYLWRHGCDDAARAAVDEMVAFWSVRTIPSRSLGLHNMAARVAADGSVRLVLIDGLGNPQFFPLSRRSRAYALRCSRHRAAAIRRDVEQLLEQKRAGLGPGRLGFLLSRG